MVGITIAWTISFFLANLLQCLPISINWTGLGGTLEACVDTEQMYLAQAWSDVFTDGSGQLYSQVVSLLTVTKW